jgi:hypothetical protein
LKFDFTEWANWTHLTPLRYTREAKRMFAAIW